MTYQEKLLRIADDHGMKAEPIDIAHVMVYIPWTRRSQDGMEHGYFKEYVRNTADMLKALGY